MHDYIRKRTHIFHDSFIFNFLLLGASFVAIIQLRVFFSFFFVAKYWRKKKGMKKARQRLRIEISNFGVLSDRKKCLLLVVIDDWK